MAWRVSAAHSSLIIGLVGIHLALLVSSLRGNTGSLVVFALAHYAIIVCTAPGLTPSRKVPVRQPSRVGVSGTVGGQLLPEPFQSTTELLVHHSPGTFPL